jgi:hypothetical protein
MYSNAGIQLEEGTNVQLEMLTLIFKDTTPCFNNWNPKRIFVQDLLIEFKFSVLMNDLALLLQKLGKTFKNLEIQVYYVNQTLGKFEKISEYTFACLENWSLTSVSEIRGKDARVHFNFKNAGTNQTFRLAAKELRINK